MRGLVLVKGRQAVTQSEQEGLKESLRQPLRPQRQTHVDVEL